MPFDISVVYFLEITKLKIPISPIVLIYLIKKPPKKAVISYVSALVRAYINSINSIANGS